MHAPAEQTANDALGFYQHFSIASVRRCARKSSSPAEMQQASAEVLPLQVAMKNRTTEPSAERDSDSEHAPLSPCSSYGEECLDENWHAAFDGGMDATCQLYDAANVHYTRQQVSSLNWHICIICTGAYLSVAVFGIRCKACWLCAEFACTLQGSEHRPAVRWQSDFHQARPVLARHSPQHAMLTPNKPCLKQVNMRFRAICGQATFACYLSKSFRSEILSSILSVSERLC